MSKTIDEQVIKMSFDNKGFEENVQKSMSTLDKLKAALHFKDVNMTPLEKAFSQAEATATQAGFHIKDVWLKMSETLENQIANKIVQSGEKIVKALTIEGALDGFNEYELKMGSIQTIMAGTGESLDTVNKYLEELNTYSDKTIYSFKDMTDNIGKFTNAGVKLDDAVAAIKGIANEAAVSGANANEASRAMYNFSQALSAGYVKLIDWKSIENANMATQEFKQTLIDVAVGLGTVVEKEGMYVTTTTDAKGSVSDLFNSTKSFNDSLSAQWMTTDVLTQALEIYATDVREMDEYEKQAYETKLKNLGLDDQQIEKFEQLGMKAADAATEIKTFSMLMDTLKEGIGSGWAMTWQYIIGDFEEAKGLWTSVGNAMGDMINKISDARNNVLKEGLSTGWSRLNEEMTNMLPSADILQEILKGAAKDSGKLSDAELEGIENTQDWINVIREKGLVTRDTLKDELSQYNNYLHEMSDKLTEAEWNEMFPDMDPAKLLRFDDFVETINKTDGHVLDPYVEDLYKLGGRENILEGLKNIISEFSKILNAVGDAWDHVFKPITGDDLYNATVKFKEFTDNLLVHEEAVEAIKTVFTVLFQTLNTGFSFVSTAIKGVSKLILPVFNLIDAIVGVVGKLIAAFTGSEGIIGLSDKMAAGGDKIREGYLNVMQWLADKLNEIAEFIRDFQDSKIYTTIAKGIDKINKAASETWDKFVQLPIVQEMMADFAKVSAQVGAVFDSINAKVGNFFNGVASKANMDTLNTVLTFLYEGAKNLVRELKGLKDSIASFFEGLREGKSIGESFKESFSGVIETFEKIKETITEFFDKLFGGENGDTRTKFETLAKTIHDFFASLDGDKVTAIALTTVFGLFAINLLRLTNAVSDTVAAIGGTFNTLKSTIASYMKKQKSVLLQIAEAIVIVAAALYILSTIDPDDMKNALKALYGISACIAVLAVVMAAVTKISNAGLPEGAKLTRMTESIIGVVGLAGAIVIAAYAVKKIAEIELGEGIIKKIGVVLGVMVILAGVATAMSRFSISKGSVASSAISVVAVAAALYIIAEAINKLSNVAKDPDTLKITLNAMLKMVVALGVISAAAGNVGGFSALGIIAVVVLFEKIMPRIEDIVNYDYTKIEAGLEANKDIIKRLGMMVGVLVVVGGLFGKGFNSLGTGLLKLVVVMGVLVLIADKVKELDASQMRKGATFMKSLTNMIAEMVVALGVYSLIAGTGGTSIGLASFIGLAGVLAVMALIASKAGDLEPEKMKNGIKFMAALTLLVDAMFVAAGISARGGGSASFKSLALVLAGISFILGLVVTLSLIDDKKGLMVAVVGTAVVILSLSALFSAVSKVASESEKVEGKITKNGVAAGPIIAVMAGVAVILAGMIMLSKQPIENIAASAIAIAVAILSFAVVFSAIRKSYGAGDTTNKKRIAVFIGSVVAVAAVMAAIIAVARFGKDAQTTLAASASISAAMLAFSVCVKSLSKISASSNQNLKFEKMWNTVKGAIVIMASVSAAIAALSNFGGSPEGMIAASTSITIGLIGVSICATAMGFACSKCENVGVENARTIIVGAIGAMAAVATAIGLLSNLGKDNESMIAAAIAIGIGTIAVGAAAVLMGVAAKIAGGVNPGECVALIGSAVGALAVVGFIMSALSENFTPESAAMMEQIAGPLALILDAVGVVCVLLGATARIVGNANVGAAAEVLGIAFLALAAIGAAAWGLGEALDAYEGLDKKIENGMNLIVMVCGKVGEAIGTLVGELLAALTDTVILGLGTTMNQVMDDEHLGGFFKKVEAVPEKALKGAKNIAGIMAAFIGVAWLDFLSIFIGGMDFSSIDMEAIGDMVADFADSVKDIDDGDLRKANIASAIALKIAEFADAMPRENGWLERIIGKKTDIGTFGDQMKELANGIFQFIIESRLYTDDDLKSAQIAVDVAAKVNDFATTIQNTGGLLAAIVGDNTLTNFSTTLVPFIQDLQMFITKAHLMVMAYPDAPKITQQVIDAVTPLNDLAHTIQNTGGLLADALGDNDLGTFSGTLVTFIENIKTMLAGIAEAEIDENTPTLMQNLVDCMSPLVTLSNTLAENKDNFLGIAETDLGEFGSQVKKFAKAIFDISGEDGTVDLVKINSISLAATTLATISAAAEGIISENIFKITDAINNLATANVAGMVEAFQNDTSVVAAVTEMLTSISTALNDNQEATTGRFKLFATTCLTSMRNGIQENKESTVLFAIKTVISDIKSVLLAKTAIEEFSIYGKRILMGISDGLRTVNEETGDSVVTIAAKYVVTSIKSIFETSFTIANYKPYGHNVSQGLADGIRERASVASQAAWDVGREVAKKLAEALDEHSPSKISEKLGRFFDEGLAIGINGGTSEVIDSVDSLGDNIKRSSSKMMDAIRNVMDTDMDLNPTIRPVLDTSDIDEKSKEISKLFSESTTINPRMMFRTEDLSLMRNVSGAFIAKENKETEVSKKEPAQNNFNFTQNNYSPKALSRLDIYRQTSNQISSLRSAMS